VQQMIGEVARRHGLALDPDDPVFVTVTLNETAVRRMLAECAALLEAAAARMEEVSRAQAAGAKAAGESLITAAADYVAAAVRTAAAEAEQRIASAGERELARLTAASAGVDRLRAKQRFAS